MGNENVDVSACIGKMLPITSHGTASLKVTQESLLPQISQHEATTHIPMLTSDSLK